MNAHPNAAKAASDRLNSSERGLNDRAIFHARPAAGAQIHVDAAGSLAHLDLEFAGFALNFFHVRIGDEFDI